MMLRSLPTRREIGVLAALALAGWSAQRWIVGYASSAPRGDRDPLVILVTITGLLLLLRPLRDITSLPASALALGIFLVASPIRLLAAGEAARSEAVTLLLSASVLGLWWAHRDQKGRATAFTLGTFIGLATLLRVENVGLLILPLGRAWTGARSWREGARDTGLSVGSVAAVMTITSRFLLGPAASAPPRIDLYGIAVRWLSSHQGLLYWHPLLWIGMIGLVLLARKNARSTWPLAAALVAISLIGSTPLADDRDGPALAAGLVGLLPLLVVGMAHAVQKGAEVLRARPALALLVPAAGAVLWNFLFMEQYRRFMIPRDDTLSFADVAAGNAALVARGAGCPLSWPANWRLSRQYDVPHATADLLIGKRVIDGSFGVVDLGDDRVDAVLLQEGWSRPLACEDAICREVHGRARMLLPLDRRERLDVIIRASGAGTMFMKVDDRPLLQWPLSERLTDTRVTASALYWKPPISQITFEASISGTARIDRLLFLRFSDQTS
ncbi:MAG: hypothetical protein JXO72_12360 [Vicinamibacteria bacterium]|nr:hypothetical protein [Vicinamibacteria bacterium]